MEPSGKAKATYYAGQWQNYVAKNRGNNVGGIAFTWRDRMEETFTWFGITDYAGRPKPAYYALRQAWTGQPALVQPLLVRVVGPDHARPGLIVAFSASLDSSVFSRDSGTCISMGHAA